MKKLIARLAMSIGAMAAPTSLLAQDSAGSNVREICIDPERAADNQRLWDFVTREDRTEVYLAYLESCGSSPVTAQFAEQARQIVIERTANFQNLPEETFRITLSGNSETGFDAVYVS